MVKEEQEEVKDIIIRNTAYCDVCGSVMDSTISPLSPDFQGLKSINVDDTLNKSIDTCSGCQAKILKAIKALIRE